MEEQTTSLPKEKPASCNNEENVLTSGMKLIGNRWSCVDPESGTTYLHNPATSSWEPATEAELKRAVELSASDPALPDSSTQDENMQCVNGTWVHRDPVSGAVSTWDSESNAWLLHQQSRSHDKHLVAAVESEETESAAELKEKTGDLETVATNQKEETSGGVLDELTFQLEQEEMERQRLVNQLSTFIDPKDGALYEWDSGKKAWFPKIDDDFIAKYQASYGVPGPAATTELPTSSKTAGIKEEEAKKIGETIREELMTPEDKKKQELEKKKEKKQKRRLAQTKQKEEGWFTVEETTNTNVYVSGLPLDITDEEFKELMAKCGLIAQDPRNRQLKLKLYRDDDGTPKGDGRCCYIKRESVDLALQILDGYNVRGKEVSVQVAQFQMKGDFDPSKKKRKLTAQQKKKFKERQERLFDWRPEKLRGERPKSDCTVILKNVFSPEDFLKNAGKLLDLEQELKDECSKYGEVKKVAIYDNNPDGVVGITFFSPEMSDDCVTMMNWRIFQGRQLQAGPWDGKTKYKIAETEEEHKKRIESWDKFLDNPE